MKIEIKQLYTALQYYRMLQKERLFVHPDEPDGGMSECADNWVHYGDYLRLLDQPLTKEMFVNPLEEPTDMFQGEQYYGSVMDSFQEAEKEVIFENCNVDHEDKIVFSGQIRKTIIEMKTPGLFIHLRKSGKRQIEPMDDRNWISIKTLHDLAEATNGQLKLKNVEI